MKRSIRRILSSVPVVLALGLALASNPTPVQAAGALFVDNNVPLCHSGAYGTIQAALAAAPAVNAKITVCPGIYLGPMVINGKTNLKLIGKKDAVIVPVFNPFNGYLIDVQNSTKVTIQGFTIDGQGHIGGTYGNAAIHIVNSSATVQKNTIQNWASPGFGLANYGIMGIFIDANAPYPIKIVNNTFSMFQSRGIQGFGPAVVNIANNKMFTMTGGATPPTSISLQGGSAGKPTGKVSGNKVTSTAFPAWGGGSTGISLYDVGPMKVSGNTLTHLDTGIGLGTEGSNGYAADGNTISGNKIYEVSTGIQFMSAGNVGNAQANLTKITGNKIVNTAGLGSIGIDFQVYASGFWYAFAQDEKVKGNTITHFTTPLYVSPSSAHVVVSGAFSPNKIKP